ncbi:MAG: diguanylate cyclase, partial [Rubrivivax sp.]|nr:diguanylate cyclase [Rubrivivax sp.]
MPRFRQAHLYDYHPAAVRAWALIVAAGAACVAWAALSLALEGQRPGGVAHLGEVLVGLGLVALAAMFPVLIPRTSYFIGVTDIFIFSLLAAAGPAPAVLAAAVDGALGTLRATQRLAPRLSNPATAALAMFVGAHAYVGWVQALQPALSPLAATVAALCAAAPVYFVFSTLVPSWLLSFKQRRPLDLLQWWRGYSWVLALYLLSAAVAAVVHVNAQQVGVTVTLVGAAVCLAVVSLLRYALNRQEWERRAQEARIAEAEREAQVNQQRFTAAFTHAAAGMAIVGPTGRMLQVNRAFCELVGAAEEGLLGKEFALLLHAGDAELFARQRAEVQLNRGRSFSIELRLLARHGAGLERAPGAPPGAAAGQGNGHDIWVSLQCSHFDDPGQTGTCLIYQLHDISSRRQAESRLQHVAFHDSLTDLANRHYFQQRLAVAVERARQNAERRFAVMFLDLDRFKLVNDSLGHVAGNHLLREVARRLVECVRGDDLVARLGGDEFAVLLESPDAHEIGPRLADRVLAALGKPLVMHGTEVVPAASIGITYSGDGRRSVDEVQRDADLAMYEAKAAGRGRVLAFDSSMHARIADKLALEADLRRAIGAGQLSVMFQPIYHLEPFG